MRRSNGNLIKSDAEKCHLIVSQNSIVKRKKYEILIELIVKVRSCYELNFTINSLSMITFQSYIKRLVKTFVCHEE